MNFYQTSHETHSILITGASWEQDSTECIAVATEHMPGQTKPSPAHTLVGLPATRMFKPRSTACM